MQDGPKFPPWRQVRSEQRWHWDAAWAIHMLIASQAPARLAAGKDRKAYLEQVAEAAAKAEEVHDTAALFQCARRLMPFKPRPPPAIRLEDGSLAKSPEDHRHRWQGYFTKLLCGKVVEADGFVMEQARRQMERSGNWAGLEESLKYLPTPAELAHDLALAKVGKAAGIDGLMAEVYRLAPRAFADLFGAVVFKTAAFGQHPIQWKGGALQEIFKGGQRSGLECSNHRGVLISDVVGKRVHKATRSHLQPYLENYATDSMCGGLAKRGTDFAAHMVRLFLQSSAQERVSSAALFVDAVAAFDRVIRELVFGAGSLDDASIARVAERLELPPDAMSELAQALQEPSAFTDAAVPGALNALVAEMHEGSWFAIEGMRTITTTAKGAKPGDPFGDIVFNFLMARVLRRAKSDMAAQGLVESVPIRGTGVFPCVEQGLSRASLTGADYIDDAVFFVRAARPEDLLAKLGAVTAMVVQTLARLGLEINFKPGKTEAVVSIHGRGAKATKEELACRTEQTLDLNVDGEQVKLRIVNEYVHMGGIVRGDHEIGPELRRRGAAAGMAYRNNTKILTMPSLTMPTRGHLSSAVVFSRLFYNAAVWPPIPVTKISGIRVPYMRALRTVATGTAASTAKTAPDVEVYRMADGAYLPIEATMRRYRLRYCHRVCAHAPAPLRALIQVGFGRKGSWVEMIIDDLEWMFDRLVVGSAARDLASPRGCLNRWETVAKDAEVWRSMMNSAFIEETAQFRRGIAVVAIPEGQGPTAAALPGYFQCPECERDFDRSDKLASHRHRVHGAKTGARLYAVGSHCGACLKEFHTRERLVYHLNVCVACLDTLRAHWVPLTVEQAAELDAAAAGEQRGNTARGFASRKAHEPVLRLRGPALPPGRDRLE